MELYLLRHGLAVELENPDRRRDFARELTGEGKRKLEHVSDALQALEISFDLILTSTYMRALQTAKIIATGLDLTEQVQCIEQLAPGASSRKLIEFINGLKKKPQRLLLVGHEPGLSQLISLLVTGDPGAFITVKKAGFCKLEVGRLKHGKCASLEWLLTSAHMRLMS
jgi:phosphohistidine phosphatase